jgi:hypothetical protein
MDLSSLFSGFGTQAPPPQPDNAYGYGSNIIWVVIIVIALIFFSRLWNGVPGYGAPPGYGGYCGYPNYPGPPGPPGFPGYPGFGTGINWIWLVLLVLAFVFFFRR